MSPTPQLSLLPAPVRSPMPPPDARQEIQLQLELVGGHSNCYRELRRFIRSKRKPGRSDLQLSLLEMLDKMIKAEPDSRSEWSLEQVEKMHHSLLDATLKSIFYYKTSPADRVEQMSWVQDEEMRAFSFNVCCGLAGVEPEELREKVVGMFVKNHPDLPLPDYERINSKNRLRRLMELGTAFYGVKGARS